MYTVLIGGRGGGRERELQLLMTEMMASGGHKKYILVFQARREHFLSGTATVEGSV